MDLISRQAAIDYFVLNVGFHDEDGYPIEDTDELRKIWTEYFDGIPPAQPEITRCKDCEHWTNDDCPFAWGKVEDAFCGYAERRTDG